MKDAVTWVGDLATKIGNLLSGPVDAIKNIAGGLFGLGVQSAAVMPATPASGGLFGAGPGEPAPGMFGAGEGTTGSGGGFFGLGGSSAGSSAPARRIVKVEINFTGLVTDRVGVAREIRKVLRDEEALTGA